MTFKHKRLEHPWQLRLVELLPRTTNNRSETIRCRILLVPGADAAKIDPHYDRSNDAKRIPYTAVSYYWGVPGQPTHKMELDGEEHEVRNNLFEYLIQRRETSASVMFWIDAFCIDQSPDEESKAERGAQVPRMTSIYMNADAIEIWLGPEGGNSTLAMDELNLLAKIVRDKIAKKRAKDGTNWLRSRLPLGSVFDEDAIELNEALMGARDSAYLAAEMVVKPFVAKAIFGLWTRPWWSRLWVVQEATVPGSKKIFMCGDRSSSWLQFMTAAALLRDSFGERLVPMDAWTMGNGMSLLATTIRCGDDPMKLLLIQRRRVGKLEDPLSSLLPMSRGLQATDNRDRVYALIGMATDVDITRFTPNYSMSEDEVYREVTRYLIRASPYGNNLDILGEAHHFEPPKSKPKSILPSWVPDWRARARTISLLKTMMDSPKVLFNSKLIYAASGPDKMIMSKHWTSGNLIEFNHDELQICGFRLDRIDQLIELPLLEDGRKISNDKLPIGCKKTWKRLRKVIPFHLGPIYRTRRYGIESIYDAFRRTVSADIQYHGISSVQGMRDPTRGVIMSDPGYSSQPFTGNDYTSCIGRKLAITHGNSMGLVSAAARVGDEIFVLAGGQVLHTLRPKGDCYTYLGDCYLHGFMDGEALQRLENGTAMLERVRIC